MASTTSPGTPCSRAMRACAHHSNSAFHRAPTVMIATSLSLRSIEVSNRRTRPSELKPPADARGMDERVERADQPALGTDQVAGPGADHAVPHRPAIGVEIVITQIRKTAVHGITIVFDGRS